jgi:hypothetical protein
VNHCHKVTGTHILHSDCKFFSQYKLLQLSKVLISANFLHNYLLKIILQSMLPITCRNCNSTYSVPPNPQRARKAKDDHSKQCPFSFKNYKGFPVTFVDGKFCRPFRYNGCLYSAKIDSVRRHQCSFGPVTGHTPETVYKDAASLRPVELGEYIEKAAGTLSVCAHNHHRSSSQIYPCFMV